MQNPATDYSDVSKAELIQRMLDLKGEITELSDFVENGCLPLHRVDGQGIILWANQAELNELGYTEAEYVGRPISDFHADAEVINDILTRLTNNEVLRNYEARLIHKDGSIRDVLINSSVYRENGEFIHTRCFTRDITDQKRVAQKMQLAKEIAESANSAKSAFLANMSHEVRTPVSAILGFSELITAPDLTADDKYNFTKAIKRNGELLTNIINDILDISKVEANQLTVDICETSVFDNLNDVLEILKLRALDKNIGFHVTSSSNVPKIVATDPLRLRQILLNVVGNAIKFTERGEVNLFVDLRTTDDGSPQLVFEVTDTGIGISAAESMKLFHPFSQADLSTTRRFGGAGLGLALSKGLANLLGGDVVLSRSEKGIGSTFILSIYPGPRQNFRTALQIDRDDKNLIQAPNDLGSVKVLLVEDSDDNRLIISRFLTKHGATVVTCENGESGVQKALDATASFDVVLMDIQMPILDGYEAITLLRKQGYTKPVIALTAHALREERQHCLDMGFDDHISKPVDRNQLAKTILNLLDNRGIS